METRFPISSAICLVRALGAHQLSRRARAEQSAPCATFDSGLTGAKVQYRPTRPRSTTSFPRSGLRKKGPSREDQINHFANFWILAKGKNVNKSNQSARGSTFPTFRTGNSNALIQRDPRLPNLRHSSDAKGRHATRAREARWPFRRRSRGLRTLHQNEPMMARRRRLRSGPSALAQSSHIHEGSTICWRILLDFLNDRRNPLHGSRLVGREPAEAECCPDEIGFALRYLYDKRPSVSGVPVGLSVAGIT